MLFLVAYSTIGQNRPSMSSSRGRRLIVCRCRFRLTTPTLCEFKWWLSDIDTITRIIEYGDKAYANPGEIAKTSVIQARLSISRDIEA